MTEKKEEPNYYGTKYGSFTWVRGSIDIYDVDDLDYIKLCLDKMGERFLKEKNDNKKTKN